MLEVLKEQFNQLVPLQCEKSALKSNSPSALAQLREHSMIKEVQMTPNPLEWQFLITSRGT